MKIHKVDLRLRNNAGIDVPVCVAQEKGPLKMPNWPTSSNHAEVTCKRCKKAWNKMYPWAREE